MSIEFRQSYPSLKPELHNFDAIDSRYLEKKVGRSALLRSTMFIDNAIEQLHRSFPLTPDTGTFEEDSLRLRTHLDHTEVQLNDKPKSPTDITDYFRLAGVHDFAVESAAIQAAFSSHEEKELRESIVDGLAGKSVARIEQALDLYDSSINPFKKKWIRGAISEQMALTMTNISENPNKIALPGTLRGDLLEKTDITIYYFAGQTGRVVPAQVKSGSKTVAPVSGININQGTLGHYNDQFSGLDPKQNFQVARILVKLMNGGELNDAENYALEISKAHFTRELDKKLSSRPGFAV